MFKMCKIIKIAFKTQVFRTIFFGGEVLSWIFYSEGGSLSHTLKTPVLALQSPGSPHSFHMMNDNILKSSVLNE